MGFFDIFKKKTAPAPRRKSFDAAKRSRLSQWLSATFTKINFDIKSGLRELVVKSRDLAKNNSIYRSHLCNVTSAVLGKNGFQLQVLARCDDGSIDRELSDRVEWEFYEFQRASNGWLTTDGRTGGVDFDSLILRTLLVDGEAFVRVVKDSRSPYGIKFRLLDGLTIDTLKNQRQAPGQNAVVCGVEVDQNQRPVAYWIRPGDEQLYQTRQLQRVPAKEIIHLYQPEFPDQVRGFPSVCAAMGALKQLEQYKVSELFAAKLNACISVYYERNQNPTAGGFLGETEDPGQFLQQMAPGQASIVPDGYTAKIPNVAHPATNFGNFVKEICRQIAASLGVSYNRLLRDYSDVSYSSLREATLDQMTVWQRWQAFLIENWKQVELRLWLASVVLNSDWLKPGDVPRILRGSNFMCAKRQWYDVAKQVGATEKQLAMGIKNPLQVIDQSGEDPDEILDGWARWDAMCAERGLKFKTQEETDGQNADGENPGGADGDSAGYGNQHSPDAGAAGG